jgi:beta-mannosidase
VRDDTWTYTREFKLDKPWAGGELVLDGVDTVADITLNGQSLGRVANEFRTHRIALPAGALKSGADGVNKLSVKILSAKAESERLAASYAYTVPSIAHVATFAGTKPFIRKAGADFGW